MLIELKPKKFDRADALQLGVYMEYYRKRMMTEGDNPPIGILMCTEVGKELAEYIAPFIDERMFLTKYMLQLPSKETLTGFLKKENEGLPKRCADGCRIEHGRVKRSTMIGEQL